MHCLWLPLYYTGRAELLWWRPCGTQKYLLTNPLLKRFADPALTETATHFFAFSTKFSLIVSSRINQPSGIPCLISSSSCQLSPSSSPLSFSSSCFSSLLCRKRLTQWDFGFISRSWAGWVPGQASIDSDVPWLKSADLQCTRGQDDHSGVAWDWRQVLLVLLPLYCWHRFPSDFAFE